MHALSELMGKLSCSRTKLAQFAFLAIGLKKHGWKLSLAFYSRSVQSANFDSASVMLVAHRAMGVL